MRKIQFQVGEYYHIYNRGVDKRRIFMDHKDYLRFLISIKEFNTIEQIGSLYLKSKIQKNMDHSHSVALKPPSGLVNFISYCLMPNHYHFLLKQTVNNGIAKFMHKLSMGYAHYFNDKYKRSGSLFQGPYQAVHIKSDHQLIQLSGYIHGNPEIHKISKAENWSWSSYSDYLGERKGTLCVKEIILNEFKDANEYKNLINSLITDFAQQKDEIREIMLEY